MPMPWRPIAETLLKWAIDSSNWSILGTVYIIPGKEPRTNWIGGWVRLRTRMDVLEKKKVKKKRRRKRSVAVFEARIISLFQLWDPTLLSSDFLNLKLCRIHCHILWWFVVLSTCAMIPTSLERVNECCWQMSRSVCGDVITTVPLLKPEVKLRKWELRLWYCANKWACWRIPVITGS